MVADSENLRVLNIISMMVDSARIDRVCVEAKEEAKTDSNNNDAPSASKAIQLHTSTAFTAIGDSDNNTHKLNRINGDSIAVNLTIHAVSQTEQTGRW